MYELALVLGVAQVIVACAVFLNTKQTKKALLGIAGNEAHLFMIGIINVFVGLSALSQSYQIDLSLAGLLAFIGWFFFLRGVLVLMFPEEVARFVKKQVKKGTLLTLLGIFSLLAGGGLTYFAWTMM